MKNSRAKLHAIKSRKCRKFYENQILILRIVIFPVIMSKGVMENCFWDLVQSRDDVSCLIPFLNDEGSEFNETGMQRCQGQKVVHTDSEEC